MITSRRHSELKRHIDRVFSDRVLARRVEIVFIRRCANWLASKNFLAAAMALRQHAADLDQR